MATAIAGARGDNATALAIQWQGARRCAVDAGDASMVSTQMLPDGEVTTRLADAAPAAGTADDRSTTTTSKRRSPRSATRSRNRRSYSNKHNQRIQGHP